MSDGTLGARAVGVMCALGVLLAAAPAHALAQQECEFADPGNDRFVQRPPFSYVTNPHFRCEGGIEIWADSAVVNFDQEMFLLLGAARYTEGTRELEADEVRYSYGVGRVQGRGNVRVADTEDGSLVENGDLVILRPTEYREVEEMTVTTADDGIRPRATVFPRRPAAADSVGLDSLAVETPPSDTLGVDTPAVDSLPVPDSVAGTSEPEEAQAYVVVADRLFFLGSAYLDATGTVEIERDSLFAYSDSARYDGDLGELVLDGSARVVGSSYDLVGRTVTMTSRSDGTDEIRSLRDAELTGEDLRVTAPQIVLHLADGELERMVAVPLPPGDGPGAMAAASDSMAAQPVAISQDLELKGDSLDLVAPTGTPERIFAAGSARSVSRGRQELNVEGLPDIARTDWIDADTIEVLLVPAAGADSAEEADDYEVDRIVARVQAHSLYRLAPADSTAVPGVDPPAVSYMVADQITIFMVEGQADRVESIGQVSGWHLEPDISPQAEEEPEDTAEDADRPDLPPDTAPGPPGNVGGDLAAPGA